MRELILKRIAELRNTWGSDLFGTPNRKGNLPMGCYWTKDFDFAAIGNDAELLHEFERVVKYSFRQR